MFKHLIFILFSLNIYSAEYEMLTTTPCLRCSTKINNKKTILYFEIQKLEGTRHYIKSLKIDSKKFKIEDAEAIERMRPINIFSIDVNNDGFEDIALNHRNGLRNEYFYYFLYNKKTKSYDLLGEYAKLLIDKDIVKNVNWDGSKRKENMFIFKNNKLIKK